MTNTAARNQVFLQMEVERHTAQYNARPAFATMTPAQRAGELIAQMDVARQHLDKAAFEAAQAELKTFFEQL